MKDKAERIEKLARTLLHLIKDANQWGCRSQGDQAARAGLLCKADLVTEMVGEFPDLQGVMGRLLRASDTRIRSGLRGHRRALRTAGPGAPCPRTPVSVAVALADKLDTLAGFFAIDERPTGSKDPFALRRAALGVIWLILEAIRGCGCRSENALAKALEVTATLLPAEPGR